MYLDDTTDTLTKLKLKTLFSLVTHNKLINNTYKILPTKHFKIVSIPHLNILHNLISSMYNGEALYRLY